MAKDWIEGASRSGIQGGEMYHDGPARAIWHITWDALALGRGPTFEQLVAYFENDKPGAAPHVLWSPFTGQIHQFIPASQSSKSVATQKYAGQPVTVESHEGATIYSPNRTGEACIQYEILFSPGRVEKGKKYSYVKDTPLKGVEKLIDFNRRHRISDGWPAGLPKKSDTATNRRVEKADWIKNGGNYGHVHVPWNSHNDPLAVGDFIVARGSRDVLMYGMYGPDIVQAKIKFGQVDAAGQPIGGDKFGAGLEKKVKAWQAKNGTKPTGRIGKLERTRLGIGTA